MSIFNRKVQCNNCGEDGEKKGYIQVFPPNKEDTEALNLKLNVKKGQVEYCHKCIEKAAIRCWLCGGSILPMEPVTLYIARKDAQIPEYAVPYKENKNDNHNRYVGCGRTCCASTGADYQGQLNWNGGVTRTPSILEQLMG